MHGCRTQREQRKMAAEHTAGEGVGAWAELLAAKADGTASNWLQQARVQGAERFKQVGWPSNRGEAWKYTRVTPIAQQAFVQAERGVAVAQTIDPALLAKTFGDVRLVFVNGHFAAQHSSLPATEGLRIEPLSRTSSDDATVRAWLDEQPAAQALTWLNTALLQDGVLIEVQRNAQIAHPIELVFINTPTAGNAPLTVQPRILVASRQGSSACVVERYVGTAVGSFTNVVTQLALEENAALEHVVVQDQAPSAFHTSTSTATLLRDARLHSTVIALGGLLARHAMHVLLQGSGAGADTAGLYLGANRQHIDMQITMEHTKPHGTSRQLFKGVLQDQACGVFGGIVKVHPNAMKTDAKQLNKNLLLSQHATAHTRPQLEILADDVKCAHGATVGQLDDNAVFYLRSRGLDPDSTRRLLTYAFAIDAVQQVKQPAVRRMCETRLRQWLALENVSEAVQ